MELVKTRKSWVACIRTRSADAGTDKRGARQDSHRPPIRCRYSCRSGSCVARGRRGCLPATNSIYQGHPYCSTHRPAFDVKTILATAYFASAKGSISAGRSRIGTGEIHSSSSCSPIVPRDEFQYKGSHRPDQEAASSRVGVVGSPRCDSAPRSFSQSAPLVITISMHAAGLIHAQSLTMRAQTPPRAGLGQQPPRTGFRCSHRSRRPSGPKLDRLQAGAPTRSACNTATTFSTASPPCWRT